MKHSQAVMCSCGDESHSSAAPAPESQRRLTKMKMDPLIEGRLLLTRRHFFGLASYSIGTAVLASLLDAELRANEPQASEGLPGLSDGLRRRFLNDLSSLNQMNLEGFADPEIATRIAQYEMAYRMQTSVPELTDLLKEPDHIFEMYGPDSRRRGSYASNCLLARRLAERGVRFIQLFHRVWDLHTNGPKQIEGQCRDTDQPSAALIRDLKQRGLLEDTLVVWGGEFGRTVYCQGKLTREDYGRDHHPRCFTIWMAGAGVKSGITFGETDDFCYNITRDPVHVHDLHATILHCLGIDHTRLTFKYQGRHHRLTDVHGRVVKEILA